MFFLFFKVSFFISNSFRF